MQPPHSTALHDHLYWAFPYSMFISAQQLTVSKLLFLIWFICVFPQLQHELQVQWLPSLLLYPKNLDQHMTCGRMNKTLSYPPAGPLLWGQNKISWKKFGKGRLCSAFSKQWNQQIEGHGLEWQNSQLKRTHKGTTLQGSGAGQKPRGRPQIIDWQNHYSVTQWLKGLVLSQMSLILLSLCFPGTWQNPSSHWMMINEPQKVWAICSPLVTTNMCVLTCTAVGKYFRYLC